ncbi:FtsW/RodA/SpoVE family cell cycle protein [Rugamonas apoptosis]|uniref:Probable peptidoglycan glycosyltransferase FtsW n=1 Tax=Rugamonas apoptosis TaxID=2758570 RepID=A0A7W2FA19_9BURK|nr:FtsW/RodA/SpoVE family cell cycle protein [Rugamonas apoptosis]
MPFARTRPRTGAAASDAARSATGAQGTVNAIARNGARAAVIALVTLLCALQAWALWRAPAAWLPATIKVMLAPGAIVTLGRHELAAPQADLAHLSLRRDADGAWLLANLSPSRQLVLQDADSERRMGSSSLQGKRAFQIDGRRFIIEQAGASGIAFSMAGQHWRYDGATLYRDGQPQPACPDTHLGARLTALWNRWAPTALTVAHPLTFGGNLHCGNRLGLPDVTPGAARLAREDGQIVLSAGNPDGEPAAVQVQRDQLASDLRRQEVPLASARALVVGHTRFELTLAGNELTMTPGRHIALYSIPQARLPSAVEWRWQQRTLWDGAGDRTVFGALAVGLAGLCLLFTARIIWVPAAKETGWRTAARWQTGAGWQAASGRQAVAGWHAAATCWTGGWLLAAGAAALVLQRAGHPPSVACSLLLACCALAVWLASPGRLSLPVAAAVILLATGLLAQLELGLGADESSWLRYYQKSAAMLAIGTALAASCRLWVRLQGSRMPQRGVEWLLMLFAAVALAALAAQVLWGDETGVFDLQPVELAKLALTALTAHCLALRFGWRHGPHHWPDRVLRWLQLAAPALLFLALLGLALVQVDDYSPLILLLVWSTSMALAYAAAARNGKLAAALLLLVLAAVAAITWLRLAGTDDLIRWGFYADRFLVWLNPAEHPHTGQQLLLGAHAVADGGWLGADHLFGLRTLGQPLGGVLRIPAVQDDFAPSFFLNRHGLAAGLLLWAVQAAFVTGIVLTAARRLAAGATARHHRAAWAGRFAYFALCGGAAFALGHFLLSWGTNLAIFPIMGQPMSFLSAGGSHLLFFLCPLLALVAASAPSSET